MSMDKTTVEKMFQDLLNAHAFYRGVKDDTDRDLAANFGAARQKVISALTTPPTNPPTIEGKSSEWTAGYLWGLSGAVEAQPQGEAKVDNMTIDPYVELAKIKKAEIKAARVPPEATSKTAEPLHDGSQRVPKGFKKIEAYTDYKTVVIMGDLYVLDGDSHNCDAMGCGSVGHVMARLPILPEPPQPTDRLLEAAKAVVEHWRKPNYDTVPYVFINLMEKMIKEIKAIEAQGGNNK
jgi:hypothetical protein